MVMTSRLKVEMQYVPIDAEFEQQIVPT